VIWPTANEQDNGDDHVDDHDGQHEEVKRRVEALVVLKVLWCGHDPSIRDERGMAIIARALR
jgi:hypothetical protein